MNPNPLRQQAYQHIQRKIMAGDLPAGGVLSENELAREIGISRTPIREAIRRLENEGVLEQVPRFGTIVRRLQRRDLVELFELREALEPYAVAQAAGRVTPDDRAMLRKLCKEIKLIADEVEARPNAVADAALMRRLLSADLGFHMLLIRASGNTRMMKIVADSRLLTRIFGTPRQEHDRAVLQETYRFHSRILDAVEAGDGETARTLMAEHIRASMREAIDHYDRHHGGGDPRTIPLGLPEDLLEELGHIESGNAGPSGRKPRKASK
jgi:DNA-binding GntR family transcriptional regulator